MDRKDGSRLLAGLPADLKELADEVLKAGARGDRRLFTAMLAHSARADLETLAAAGPSRDRRVALLAMALEVERVAELLEHRLGLPARRRVRHQGPRVGTAAFRCPPPRGQESPTWAALGQTRSLWAHRSSVKLHGPPRPPCSPRDRGVGEKIPVERRR